MKGKCPRKLLWFNLPRGATIPLSVPAPAEILRFWRLVKLNPGEMFTGIIRSTKLFSTFVHWIPAAKTYAPCLLEAGVPCDSCDQIPKRYLAALAVYTPNAPHEPCLLCLPRMAVRECPDLELCEGPGLVGRQITAKRGPFKRSRVKLALSPERRLEIPAEKQVQPAEVLAQLLLVWGVRYREGHEVPELAHAADPRPVDYEEPENFGEEMNGGIPT